MSKTVSPDMLIITGVTTVFFCPKTDGNFCPSTTEITAD